MQTRLADFIRDTHAGHEAETILRQCVHCGFCAATCPTYGLLSDELDSPRGRIYQIKHLLEGDPVTAHTQRHLDRCLTCQACETTCPSGVRYGRLLDIGRSVIEQRHPRPLRQRLMRKALAGVLPVNALMAPAIRLGQRLKPLLPAAIARKVPNTQPRLPWPEPRHPRRVIALTGCIQAITTPNTNHALATLLDRCGISLIAAPTAGCCGAIEHHLGESQAALHRMRRNIDAWWPLIDAGAETLLVAASGCGVTVKDYGHQLAHDPHYADKADTIAKLARDPVELLETLPLTSLPIHSHGRRIAFHAPCTLQHGQQLSGRIETLLTRLGFELTDVPDAHLCCGSAGTYSLLQPELSQRLLNNKLTALESGAPTRIATANIGCQLHLATAATLPVMHWLDLLAQALDT